MSSARPTGAAILTLLLAATAACPAAVRAATPEPPIVRDCADCPELVVLPAGAFLLGTSADAYEHDKVSGETPPLAVVIRRPFALGRFEVQVQEWRRFVAATGYRPAHACALDAAAAPAAPARCVTAADAEAYLEWLGRRTGRRYRLPSESEWEYAARAATTGARFWSNRDSHEGVSISRACDFANVHDVASRALQPAVPHARCIDHYTGPAPVGSFAPNPWGLYDLVGNVRELLADCSTPAATKVGRRTSARGPGRTAAIERFVAAPGCRGRWPHAVPRAISWPSMRPARPCRMSASAWHATLTTPKRTNSLLTNVCEIFGVRSTRYRRGNGASLRCRDARSTARQYGVRTRLVPERRRTAR